MLVPRTIRGKMLVWLALLALLLVGLSATSITGLRSYRRTKEDLELSIRAAPGASADLATAISLLFQPCVIEVPLAPPEARQEAARFQQSQLQAALGEAQSRVDVFRSRLDALAAFGHSSTLESTAYRMLFKRLDEGFANLSGEAACLTREEREKHLRFILREAADLLGTINSYPDPAERLADRLSRLSTTTTGGSSSSGVFRVWRSCCLSRW